MLITATKFISLIALSILILGCSSTSGDFNPDALPKAELASIRDGSSSFFKNTQIVAVDGVVVKLPSFFYTSVAPGLHKIAWIETHSGDTIRTGYLTALFEPGKEYLIGVLDETRQRIEIWEKETGEIISY